MDSPDRQFDAFAVREPWFSVLTSPQFLRANLTPDTEREFFATGERLVDWMLNVVHAGLAPGFAPVATLEYGCGIGRLALPFARHAGSVTAVDRSAPMLDLGRREATRAGLDHISFLTPKELMSAPRTFDLVVCYHVLQRLRSDDAELLMRRLFGLIGPAGIGVFQWPYRTRASGLVAATRWARERIPGANRLSNRARGKAADEPFIPTHVHELARMFALIEEAGFRSTHAVFDDEDDLAVVTVLAQRTPRAAGRVVGMANTPAPAPGSPRVEPAAQDIDAFNRSAELYFSSLDNWDHHLGKPFSQPAEAPALLANTATVLHALDLSPGLRVLDFGAGSGWLSHAFTQLGCEAILVDVSPTALHIAEELYRRHPPVGDRPAPRFLVYDGRRFDLPDASVDRIVCFDAFHHAPDPDATIREFARILAPGGRAVFAEPGPRHSETARSQFESRTYGVVEKDVDVHALWRTARACGFNEIKMCVFHEPAYFVPLEEYEDLVAGGPAQQRWMASTQLFLRHVRNFYLVKAGTARKDSRTTDGLACDVRATIIRGEADAPGTTAIDAIVTNTGTATWRASGVEPGGVSLGAHLYDAEGQLLKLDLVRASLSNPPRDISPGEVVKCRLTLPPLAAGSYEIELDCVAAGVTWFAQAGSKTVRLTI